LGDNFAPSPRKRHREVFAANVPLPVPSRSLWER
jgi:hypothetical protein